MHVYEIRPRKDHRGVDLISDRLPFGRLWYDGANTIGYAQFRSALPITAPNALVGSGRRLGPRCSINASNTSRLPKEDHRLASVMDSAATLDSHLRPHDS